MTPLDGLRDALKERQEQISAGDDSPATFQSLNNLLLLIEQEEKKEAIEMFKKAKELCDKHKKLDRRIVYGDALIQHFDAVLKALER